MKPYTDLVGQTFGRLTVVAYEKRSRWKCLCECGNFHTAVGYDLKRGITQSCGCYGIDQRRAATQTHGKSNTPEYRTWANMIQRCTNEKSRMYYRYGGRGITVCERWRKFENFLADMGRKPSPMHTIDRIDSDGDYDPDNCRWLPKAEQSSNRSNTIRIDGKTIHELAKEAGVKAHTMYQRVRRKRNLVTDEGDVHDAPKTSKS